MKQLFVQRVKEKEAILKEAEREASVLFAVISVYLGCPINLRIYLKN